MSNWFYAENNQQVGPVSEAMLREKIARGQVSSDTLIWQPGMARWTRLAEVPHLAKVPGHGAGTEASPLPSTGPLSTGSPAREFTVGSVVSEAWAIFRRNPGGLSGASFVSTTVILLVVIVFNFIPVLGPLATNVFAAIIAVGMWKLWLVVVDDGTIDLGLLFSQSRHWLGLTLANLALAMTMIAFMALLVLPLLVIYAASGLTFNETHPVLSLILFLGCGVAAIPGFLIALLFSLMPIIVADRGINPFRAFDESYYLVKPHLWTWILLGLAEFAILMGGFICLIIGVFPALALVYTINAQAYRRLAPKTIMENL